MRYFEESKRYSLSLAVLGLALAVGFGFLVAELLTDRILGEAQNKLEERVANLAADVTGKTMYSPAMGAAMLRGLDEPDFKRAVSDAELKPAEQESIRLRLRPIRQLFGAEGVFLVSGKGFIVVHDTDGKNSVGTNVSFRPYFQQSMAGKSSVYAAFGNNSAERGLYYTAPVYAADTKNSQVIGVIVVKYLGDGLDEALKGAGEEALLLSPQGVVFASTHKSWLFNLTPPITPERINSIRALKQFGKLFEDGTPIALPFDLNLEIVRFDGGEYLLTSHAINWGDPAGDWRIVAISNSERELPVVLRFAVGAISALLMGGVLLILWSFLMARQRQLQGQARYAMLGTALEKAPVAVVIADAQGRISWVNPQFERKSGFSLEDVRNKTTQSIIGGSSHSLTVRELKATLSEGRIWRGEVSNRRKDGTLRWDATTVAPVFDDAQTLIGYVALQEDVSERRELVARLEEKIDLDDHLNRLTRMFKGQVDPMQLSNIALTEMVRYLGAPYAAVHSADDTRMVFASIGGNGNMAVKRDQLVDDVAKSGQPMVLRDLPPTFSITLGGQNVALSQVQLLPVVCSSIMCGVLELGLLADLDEKRRIYLERAMDEFSVALKMALDFSHQQQMEIRLAEQEERRSLLLEAVDEGIVGVDTTGHVTFMNPAAFRMLKPADGQGFGQDIHTIIRLGDESGFDNNTHSGHLYDAYSYSLSSRRDGEKLRLHDGREFMADYSILPIRRKNELVGAVMVFRDITERIAQQSAVQQANERLADQLAFQEALVNTIPYPVFYLGADSRFLGLNDAYEQIFNVRRADLIGKRVIDLDHLPEDTRQTFQQEDEDTIAKVSSVRREVSLPFADGHVHEALYFVSGFRRADGGPGGLVGTLVDITEQKSAERAMQEAKLLAEEAVRMKGEFLANMSHEIRTPMNAIIGITYLAMKTELNSRQRDYLVKIQQSGQHLLGVLNDILDFSKIEAGKLDVEKTEFNLSSVLENVTGVVAEKCAAKGLEFVIDAGKDIPDVLIGDPLRIGQILINYANNAVKFTEHGEIDIVVRKISDNEDEIDLRFEVTDTGIGLTQEQISRLFQSFQQGDASTTRRYGGTGLGLVISKRLAELMNGTVGVESEYGKGATFWFEVKMLKAKRKHRALLPRPDLRGMNVLVADDNAYARAVICEMLTGLSFQVEVVDNGQRAVEAVQRADERGTPYRIVMLDWQMPVMDGITAAKKIKALKLASLPHLVLVTAYGSEEVAKGAAGVGFDEILLKPVNPSILFDTVMQVMGAGDPSRQERKVLAEPEDVELERIQGARILLVEDNDLNQQVATELLSDVGFQVDLAENGAIAVAMVQKASYDLVLMDMQMPVMDGIVATVEIRKLPQFKELPIVAMTANVMQRDQERCLAAGMNDHLAKPIDPDALQKVLLKWIKPRQFDRPVRSSKQSQPGGESGNASHAGDSSKTDGDAGAELGQLTPKSAKPSAADDTLPRDIAGLDVDRGLKFVGGRTSLYRSLLDRFASGQRSVPGQIRDALDADDLSSAERSAHTLKGTAATLGAADLSALAAKLENAIKEKQDRQILDDMIATVTESLNTLIAAIERSSVPAQAEPVTAVTVDDDALQAGFEKLSGLLSEDDLAASSVFDELSPLLKAAFPKEFEAIGQAVHTLDLQEALHLLTQAMQDRRKE